MVGALLLPHLFAIIPTRLALADILGLDVEKYTVEGDEDLEIQGVMTGQRKNTEGPRGI